MYLINLNTTDPPFNLAFEEYLLKSSREDFFLLYTNSPSVIIGKHQVAHRETDTRFITEKMIPLYRRISGGGTVYHDNGNLNFTYIVNGEEGKQVDFRKYGINASFEGKNDLKIEGLKFSGNAEHVYRKRILHHGTLLFDSSLDLLRGALRKDSSNYTTRAVPSNPSPVVNLRGSFIRGLTTEEFREELFSFFAENTRGEVMEPEEKLVEEVKKLAERKFRTWEWNYAYGPEYQYSNKFVWQGIHYNLRMDVKDGLIRACEISGTGPLRMAEARLAGKRHMPDIVSSVLTEEGLQPGLEYNFF